MKTQRQIGNHFPELVARLEYLNPIKNSFSQNLKYRLSVERIANFATNRSKMRNDKAIFHIVKRLKIPFLDRPYQKQPLVKIKMSQEGQKLVETEVQ